ncbi:hypothetical protein [Thalassococcus sp. S3]|uniref:hypothetical protein n=1 Tax=Thalassococcus sp. S3 TaxID=2017482 RepID=UPI0015836128|nr:hypothetical protein [Thalassococcus sp. S3]
MIRSLFVLIFALFLTACATQDGVPEKVSLGDFRLGHNVVVASKMQKGPVSRDATEEEWVAALTSAINTRFGQYEGDQLYHFGVSVEGYMLAPPGVPLVYTPKSALIINVTLWDDESAQKLNEAVHQITVLESTDEDSVIIGSGWGRTKEEQLEGLSFNAARAIQRWMLEQSETYGWFTPNEVVMPADAEKPQREVTTR